VFGAFFIFEMTKAVQQPFSHGFGVDVLLPAKLNDHTIMRTKLPEVIKSLIDGL
jgi:hypothetical protein